MTNEDKVILKNLKENECAEALEILNRVRFALEEMGRVRDCQRFTKIVDLIDEWRRDK